jgi:hypothetical protein
MCIPTYVHTYICTYLHMYIPTYVHTYICTYLHMCMPTYVHTYICTYLCMYLVIKCKTLFTHFYSNYIKVLKICIQAVFFLYRKKISLWLHYKYFLNKLGSFLHKSLFTFFGHADSNKSFCRRNCAQKVSVRHRLDYFDCRPRVRTIEI